MTTWCEYQFSEQHSPEKLHLSGSLGIPLSKDCHNPAAGVLGDGC